MSIDCRINIDRPNFSLDIELAIASTGITGITGPSGGGKTTLLRAMAGLEKNSRGYLRVGDAIWQDAMHFTPPHQRQLGYVFQEASLFAHLNVQDNLQYGMRRVPNSQRKVSIDRAIDLLGIAPLLQRKPTQLSGGERQRVAIARALAVSPKILLMDEPLSALDIQRKREIMPYLETLHGELDIPIIYVSHALDELARLADHLVLIDNGKVKDSGAIGDMLTNFDLPLARGDDAAALINGQVSGHDDEFQLTYIDFAGGRFTVAKKPLAIGHPVRLSIAARDTSLTKQHQSDTSILNIFPATVQAITAEGNSQVMVRLSAQGTPLLSRITRKSAELLALDKGSEVFVQIKTVALLA
ncbi:MAG: molybdenum ABC transporter ATP-binding protein [Porticoccaceae bacterium]|nr:molybdenum ABC transporter ATP-binding protein [Porticoccaceae bacterium]